jgi:uncharacterized protein (TIGR03085 family)
VIALVGQTRRMTLNFAQIERQELCNLFEQLGPDVPTLCEGWTARDLAAHLVVRERRPDAALGILAAPFERHGEKVRLEYAAKPWDELVELVRSGPPTLSVFGPAAVDRLANTMEYFIHHEDLRRTNGMGPRELYPELQDQLWAVVRRMSRLTMRSAPCGVTLRTTGGATVVANGAVPRVAVRGPVGELALFVYGRQAAAQVELLGSDDDVAALMAASFGI